MTAFLIFSAFILGLTSGARLMLWWLRPKARSTLPAWPPPPSSTSPRPVSYGYPWRRP